ncbi:MAG: SHOCT domain-containing protein [Verrucomicrobiota bacterium]
MAIRRTRGTLRASKANAIFRILFGLFFIGLGISQYVRYPGAPLPYFSLGIGMLFFVYGIFVLFNSRVVGNQLDLETVTPPTEERLAEITRLKASGLITEQEFEAKRQEILKDV